MKNKEKTSLTNKYGYLDYGYPDEWMLDNCEFCVGSHPKAIVIEQIEIKRGFRNKGHGTRLLKRFLNFAKKKGFKYVLLQAWPLGVSKNNWRFEEIQEKLVNWYKSFGFKDLDFHYMRKRI